ncbi:hypothetical protein [Halorhodospira halophila]|uniref:hypothetical protein n=1 Tax=Halorhodospira halophila TaxID=1053 RepID=UPI0019132F18|nr:hypothetical protein [Halorhodospira halophila]
MTDEQERRGVLNGFSNAQGFEVFDRELLARAHEANEQMNAFSGELDRDERACRHARQAARVAEHLQRRVMATASWVSLDPHGKRTEGLHDLACTLHADQLLALEWREGIVRGESGLSEAERRAQVRQFIR